MSMPGLLVPREKEYFSTHFTIDPNTEKASCLLRWISRDFFTVNKNKAEKMWGIGCCPGKKIQSPLSSDMQDHPSKRCSFYLTLRRRKKATTKCWSLSLLHEKKNLDKRDLERRYLSSSLFHTPAMLERGWCGAGHNTVNSSSFFPLVRALLFLIEFMEVR